MVSKVRQGQPLSARAWNEIVDQVSIRPSARNVIQLSVVSNVAAEAFGLVIPDEEQYFDVQHPLFRVNQFELDNFARNHLLYLTNPVPQGGVGFVEPVTPGIPYLLRYEGTQPEFGNRLAPKVSSTAVEINHGGDFLALCDGNTTVELVWAIKENRPIEVGKLNSSMSAGDAVDVSIWRHDGVSWTDSGVDIADVLDWLLDAGQMLSSGDKVVICKINGQWVITEVWCPEPA